MAEAAVADKAATTTDTAAAAATKGATTTTDKGASASTTAAAVSTTDKGTATVASTTEAAAATNDAAKGYWPDDWQGRVSKGDDKRAKALGKFHSPEALADSYFALERRFSSGEYKPVLPKDPKADELTAWRKDNGIPDKPEGYDLKGLTIPKEDAEVISGFLKAAHSTNMTPTQARTAVESYYAEQQRQSQARAEKDDAQRHAALDTLNQEWGGSFRRNVNLIEGTILSKFPEDVRELIKSARLPDGTALFNSVPALKALASLALEINPAGVVAPGGSGEISKSAIEEYRELQTFMREKRSAYNKDGAKQARMTALIEYLSKQELIDANGNLVAQKKAA